MLRWLKSLLPAPADAGARGEKLAAHFLRRSRGMTVVARNWRSPRDRRDELDLVCRDGDALVFVEVKTRAASALVPGYFAVDERKRDVVRRATRAFLAGLRGAAPRTFRFDVVEVELPPANAPRGTAAEVRHFENVPLFPKNFRAGG